MATVFNQIEFALACLHSSKSLVHDSVVEDLDSLVYYEFLRQLGKKAARVPEVFPVSFASKYTFEESVARFKISPNSDGAGNDDSGLDVAVTSSVTGLLRRIPGVAHLASNTRNGLIRVFRSLDYRIRNVAIILRGDLLKRDRILKGSRKSRSCWSIMAYRLKPRYLGRTGSFSYNIERVHRVATNITVWSPVQAAEGLVNSGLV